MNGREAVHGGELPDYLTGKEKETAEQFRRIDALVVRVRKLEEAAAAAAAERERATAAIDGLAGAGGLAVDVKVSG